MSASQRGLQLPDTRRSRWWQSEEDVVEGRQETVCEAGAPRQRAFTSEGTVAVSGPTLGQGHPQGL